ncbi:MAG: dihydropteroate synthase, partial [Coriobacteriaceae bacterium]|nr:dihydropteroate synthase [Coriobacteriaceae bacterium]
MKWHCASYEFDTIMPIIMGILNITPDSFSDGGRYQDKATALACARNMVNQGAQIIDVGGESTRPGSQTVSAEEELGRIIDVVKELAREGICVSVDTRHVSVAAACIEAGASIINDISGFRDPAMIELAAQSSAGVVCVHMQGEPQTMQENPHYDDVVAEVRTYLLDRAIQLENCGVAHERICIDPGPGFGKTNQHTLELVRNFHEFARLGYPVMAALSRKSYIGEVYHLEAPQERDEASATETVMACELGASILRVHNVACQVAALKDLRPYALLGLGSNLALEAPKSEETLSNEEQEAKKQAAKIAQINQAISFLCTLPDSQVVDVSSLYESEPAYLVDQDSFINAVVLISTGLPPKELLKYLHAIENSLGRVREVENGPRTCDIDMLDYQKYVCNTEVLTLPHPRILERDFVVAPLLEIRPKHILAND